MNSSNPDIKVKKRYNKFMAFLLANGVVATVLYCNACGRYSKRK